MPFLEFGTSIKTKGVYAQNISGNTLQLNGVQRINEIVTGITSGSTNLQSPSAHAVYVIVNNNKDKYYHYTQNIPSAIWNVTHNLGKYPSVTVVDSANTTIEGQVEYIDINSVRITFSASFSGYAELN